MQQTVRIKLLPTKEQEQYLINISEEYINTINNLVDKMIKAKEILKLSSKDTQANMPSAVKNQAIRDAKSVYRKAKKLNKVPILKKPVCIWNNQNYQIKNNVIEFPVMLNSKSKRIAIRGIFTEYQINLLSNKLGTLRITKKSNKWLAQITVTISATISNGTKKLGVDLGLKVPAVVVTEEGKTKFFGNGRKNKYIKRKYKTSRKKLGKAKKLKAIKRINDKEQRYMKDQDHKVSRNIINFAKENNVSIIRLEQLSNIRKTARTSRKNEYNIHSWSFYRLALFIEYKANLEGIKVEYVDPKYTSQICPVCNTKNKAKDRTYKCSCGYNTHRDRVGAINIINAPMIGGKSLSA